MTYATSYYTPTPAEEGCKYIEVCRYSVFTR